MPTIHSNDTSINYDYQEPAQVRNEPVLVFIHGLSLDLRFWNEFVPFFNAKGYRTVTYDIRGHGKSGVPQSGYGISRRIQDLKNILDDLNISGKIILIGHSLGGSEALNFAIQYPEYVRGMVLIDTWITGFKPNEQSPMLFNANKVAQRESVQAAIEGFRELGLFDLEVKKEESTKLLGQMQHDHPGGLWLDNRSIRDPSFKALDKLDVLQSKSVLVLVGEHDFKDFQDIATLLHEQLSTSIKEVITGVKHMGPLDKPEEITYRIDNWLQTVVSNSNDQMYH